MSFEEIKIQESLFVPETASCDVTEGVNLLLKYSRLNRSDITFSWLLYQAIGNKVPYSEVTMLSIIIVQERLCHVLVIC